MSLFNRFFGKNPTQSKSVVPEETQKLESGSEMSEPIISPEVTTVMSAESTNPAYDKRTIRVFISSTFRDMVEDRNALMTHCWPELRRFCKDRQVELVEVDLRWGIAEEQSTRKETLKLCLDEIRACRPFFIGLLGERYGWVPDDNAFTKDLMEEQPWLSEINGKSVTELEILHGVLNNPEMAGRAYFYFRDPKYVETVPKEKKADFLSETDTDADKQTELKDLIRKICIARNIPLLETYPDPQSLAPIVLEQLKAAIENQFPVEEIPDPLTREARDHEAYAESRRRTYIGRPDYFDTLNKHCLDTGKPLVLLGDSGSGKSALLANWVDRWRKTHPNDFIFQHYIGGTPDGSVHWKLMTRLMAEIKRWTDDPEELPKTNDDMLRDFPLWLSKARIIAEHRGVRCVIILDALNQLEDKDYGRLLGWLPEHPFTGSLRLIVSTLPGDTMEAIEKRDWLTLKIKPLEVEERRRMIIEYLARFSKKMDEPRLDRLSAETAASNPLYLKILLDELRVTGTHEKLDERLDNYLSAKDISSLLNKVLARYQRDYEHDRKGLVSEALGLIWAARRGLTETELLELLRPNNLPQLPLVIWSPLRATLEDSLIERGGILNFAHDFLRTAVENAFLPDLDKKDDYRIQLADYFEPLLPTERSCDELPWLLWKSEQFERLQKCLLNLNCFMEINDRDIHEVLKYWVDLGEEKKKIGKLYLDAFNEWSNGKKSEEVFFTANALGSLFFTLSLYFYTESFYKKALEITELDIDKNHDRVVGCLNNLAKIFSQTARHSEAELILRKSLKICEDYDDKVGESTCLCNIGAEYLFSNRFRDAELILLRSIRLTEKIFGEKAVEILVPYLNLGSVFNCLERYKESEFYFRRALKISEYNYGIDHPNLFPALNKMAGFLSEREQFEEAKALWERSIQIIGKYFGEDSLYLADPLYELALLLMETNCLKEVESILLRVLKISEESLGTDYPESNINIFEALIRLSQLFTDNDQLIESVSVLQNVIKLTENRFGNLHPIVGTCFTAIGQYHMRLEQLTEAEPIFLRALEIFEACSKKNDESVEKCLINLSIIYVSSKRFYDAIQSQTRLLEIIEMRVGKDKPEVAFALRQLAYVLCLANRFDEAEPLQRKAIGIVVEYFGQDHAEVIPYINNLVKLLENVNRLDEVEPLLYWVLKIDEISFGMNHIAVAKDLVNIARILCNTKRFIEAVPFLERSLEIERKNHGNDYLELWKYHDEIANIYCKINRLKEAEPHGRRIIEILIKFALNTGSPHPSFEISLKNYVNLIKALGWSKEQIFAQIHNIAPEFYKL
jgi:nephrocystin-3